jgi:acylphosphatase
VPDLARKAVRVRVFGRVQGVWYRGWTLDQARALGLGGWVRNRSDGSVEALFAGPAAAVDAMVEACRRGPSAALVQRLAVEPAEEPTDAHFAQWPTL